MSQGERVNTATDHGCFGCGEQNAIGLKLRFHRTDEGIVAHFTPAEQYEGYTRLTHGGIIATLLDEAMSWAVIDSGTLAVTARMEVEYRRPVPIGQSLTVFGTVERDRGRVVQARAELRAPDGELLAAARGRFMRVSPEQQAEWSERYLGEGRGG